MASDAYGIISYQSDDERSGRERLFQLLKNCPIPEDQLLSNLGLFLDSKNLARILFFDFLFRQIIDVQGVIMEFGIRWGQNLGLFSAMRGIYDPFNRQRKIIGFDTFQGFPSISPEDGTSDMMKPNNLAVADGYAEYLSQILKAHESLNPLSHLDKFKLCAGDGPQELEKYLALAPETIIALAYFDFDLYEPSLKCMELIKDRVTKGSVIGLDEVNDPDSPGETKALMEAFGLKNIQLKRFPIASRVSYFVVE